MMFDCDDHNYRSALRECPWCRIEEVEASMKRFLDANTTLEYWAMKDEFAKLLEKK
jgi:hypothetical protein